MADTLSTDQVVKMIAVVMTELSAFEVLLQNKGLVTAQEIDFMRNLVSKHGQAEKMAEEILAVLSENPTNPDPGFIKRALRLVPKDPTRSADTEGSEGDGK